MKTGDIVRHLGQIGVVLNKTPMGKASCLFGNEAKRSVLDINPSALAPIEIIDLTPQEHEDVLHLMQALVFLLVENNEPF
jgi:hypothetical protein